jgi:predicted nuclease of restriction endonuclease-like (RecB) superfamily
VTSVLPKHYTRLLEDLKARIRSAQLRAAFAANKELLLLYYDIGLMIDARSRTEAWGTAVIDRIARDLRREFPGMEGLSPRNLRRMRAFYRAYPLSEADAAIWPQVVAKLGLVKWPPAVAELPWAHNLILLEKLKEPAERAWYAQAAVNHGWSRNILIQQIESNLRKRQGKATTNFTRALPQPQSELAQQALKDPYVFDFLTLSVNARERDLETQLTQHVARFLVELGAGFAYVGRQIHLDVGGQDFFLDLLFYHTRLHCYVVIELKDGAFKPEYAGKMNFYLSAVDDQLRQKDDKPTIGLLLCRTRNTLIAEYALRNVQKPIGVAQWKTQWTRAIPPDLKSALPTVREIERELSGVKKNTSRHKKETPN